MLIDLQTVKAIEDENRRQLASRTLRRSSGRSGAVRRAVALTLIAWARRLAPELPPPLLPTRKARAAPN